MLSIACAWAGAMLLTAAGCSTSFWSKADTPQSVREIAPADVRPGMLCQIDMVVPPTAASGSYQCYTGKVAEVTAEEIVLAGATEEGRIQYGTSPRRAAATVRERETVRVPIAGVATIQVADPPPTDSRWLPKPAKP
jgi:hypothetical protein